MCLLAIAVVPLARGESAFQEIDVRVAAIACLALVAALAQGWTSLVPTSLALVGGAYAAELALDDAPLDLAAPAVALGVLLSAELAYWSLDERARAGGDLGQSLGRAARVALGAAGAFVVCTALLALVDEVRAGGLAPHVLGAAAAVAVVVMVVVAGRDQSSNGS